jgi:hypothetical protein
MENFIIFTWYHSKIYHIKVKMKNDFQSWWLLEEKKMRKHINNIKHIKMSYVYTRRDFFILFYRKSKLSVDKFMWKKE